MKDTLSVALQDGVVRLVGVLHGDSLGKFSQHPLLEVLQPFVVVASANKLLVLESTRSDKQGDVDAKK